MVLDRAPGMRIPLFVAEHLPGTIEGTRHRLRRACQGVIVAAL